LRQDDDRQFTDEDIPIEPALGGCSGCGFSPSEEGIVAFLRLTIEGNFHAGDIGLGRGRDEER